MTINNWIYPKIYGLTNGLGFSIYELEFSVLMTMSKKKIFRKFKDLKCIQGSGFTRDLGFMI